MAHRPTLAHAEPMPIAAPTPSSHHAAMAAYDRVVAAKPPFAYESANTAAAIAIPAAASRRSVLCRPFTSLGGTGSYSSGVLGGLRRVLLAAVVAGAALGAPAAAFACGGGPSAVNVYKECLPTGGGDQPTSSATSTGPVHLSPQAARALAHAGKDGALLSALVRSGAPRHLPTAGGASAAEPSALGSAVDLGSGPTALLAVLAGTAVVLLGVSGVRVWRRRADG